MKINYFIKATNSLGSFNLRKDHSDRHWQKAMHVTIENRMEGGAGREGEVRSNP